MNLLTSSRFAALLYLLITLSITASAQEDWWQRYGGDGSDRFESVVVAANGDRIYAGSTNSFGNNDLLNYVVRTDADGLLLWERTYSLGTQANRLHSIIETTSGNLAMTGVSDYPVSETTLIITDASGNPILSTTYGLLDDGSGQDLLQTSDGGFLIVGTARNASGNGDFSLLKIDASGTVEWTQNYGGNQWETAYNVFETSNGDFIVTGTEGNIGTYVIRVAADGTLIWDQVFSDIQFGRSACLTTDDELLIAGGNPNFIVVKKLDGSGNELWNSAPITTPLSNTFAHDIIAVNGGFVLAGNTALAGGVGDAIGFMAKIDDNGGLLWRQMYGTGAGENFFALDVASNGDLLAVGYTNVNRSFDGYAIEVDQDGNITDNFVTGQLIGDTNADCIQDMGEIGARDLVLVLESNHFPNRFYYELIAPDGSFNIAVDTGAYLFSLQQAGLGTWEFCNSVTVDNFGGTEDIGVELINFTPPPLPDLYCFGQIILDTSGNCMKDFGEPGLDNWRVTALSSNGQRTYAATSEVDGHYNLSMPGGDTYKVFLTPPQAQGWVFCMDTMIVDSVLVAQTSGESHDWMVQFAEPPGAIEALVYFDEDGDCQRDPGEPGLQDWEVAVRPVGGAAGFGGLTDANGEFGVDLQPAGLYDVVLFNYSNAWTACLDSVRINLSSGDTARVTFGLQAVAPCTEMEVDISTPLLRNCSENTYHVRYCNRGNTEATDVEVEIILDPALSYVNSSIPPDSQTGGLRFNVGDVDFNECGTFTITVFLDCNAQVGLTHCVEAHIFPDTLCGAANNAWDGSSIALNALCQNDSVFFQITNEGTFDMQQAQGYIVIEDNVLIRAGTFQLLMGEDTMMNAVPRGATLRMEAEQSAAHPGQSMPSIAVEGCGTNSNGMISLGYVTQYPQDDADLFRSIDCQESIASFDPNIKRAYPKGITDAHYITPNLDLEYHLHFQNTGTDTAFLVILDDTLSTFLDPTSLHPGVSSHDYVFELVDGNIARFTFNNILLPDSSTNELGSMGFVKFRIAQTSDNPPGTVIPNSAAIYFDSNAPVITNTTIHQIPLPLLSGTNEMDICEGDLLGDIPIQGDTLLIDSLNFVYFDSVLVTQINSLPGFTSSVDVTLLSGETYQGTAYFQDTTITEVYAAANGCDSLVTVNIMVNTVNTTELDTNPLQFNIFPNPAANHCFASFDLPAREAQVTIDLVNGLGQSLRTLITAQAMPAGHYRMELNTGDLPAGSYYLRLRSSQGTIYKRLVIM